VPVILIRLGVCRSTIALAGEHISGQRGGGALIVDVDICYRLF